MQHAIQTSGHWRADEAAQTMTAMSTLPKNTAVAELR